LGGDLQNQHGGTVIEQEAATRLRPPGLPQSPAVDLGRLSQHAGEQAVTLERQDLRISHKLILDCRFQTADLLIHKDKDGNRTEITVQQPLWVTHFKSAICNLQFAI
jgi:hypothetical protein